VLRITIYVSCICAWQCTQTRAIFMQGCTHVCTCRYNDVHYCTTKAVTAVNLHFMHTYKCTQTHVHTFIRKHTNTKTERERETGTEREGGGKREMRTQKHTHTYSFSLCLSLSHTHTSMNTTGEFPPRIKAHQSSQLRPYLPAKEHVLTQLAS